MTRKFGALPPPGSGWQIGKTAAPISEENSMGNRDIRAALLYHNGTKYPDGDLLVKDYTFDSTQQVVVFKRYPGLAPITLSPDAQPGKISVLDAITGQIYPSRGEQVPDINTLAKILHFSAGITKRINIYGNKNRPFRAAACTGALYHIELYVVCGDLPGLEAGVYHFDVGGSLRQLRSGDYRAILREASDFEPSVSNAPAILLYTDVFWRNAIKYESREYRHTFWDCGTILANTLAVATACGIPAKVVAGFVDSSVDKLLDIETIRESTIVMVSLGHSPSGNSQKGKSEIPSVSRLSLEVFPNPENEKPFPAIADIHTSSSLETLEDVAVWRAQIPDLRAENLGGNLIKLKPCKIREVAPDPVGSVIIRRGSTRHFGRVPISLRELSTILCRTSNPVPADFLTVGRVPLNDIYLIVNDVGGLEPGTYVFLRRENALERLAEGDFRDKAKALAVDQDLAGDASVNIYFLCDLAPILEAFGNRGYRAAQLDASITAGRMYLAAYAQKLGATGLTFFDDRVTSLFSPHAEGKSVMFLLALGKRAVRA